MLNMALATDRIRGLKLGLHPKTIEGVFLIQNGYTLNKEAQIVFEEIQL